MLQALREVDAVIVVDGVTEFDGTLQANEARTFEGHRAVDVTFGRGGVVRLQVNRTKLGTPGNPSSPYHATFRPEEPEGKEESSTPA
jgi:hypothetical protein